MTTVDSSAFDVLAQTLVTLRALLSTVPQEVVEAPADEGWSPKDVVAHLLATLPSTVVDRVRLILDADDPPLPNVDEQEALHSSGLRPKPLDELLDELERRRAEVVAWLRELTPEQLERTGRHEVAGEISIADLATMIWSMIRGDEPPKIKYVPYETFGKYEDVRRRVPDITRARTLLVFEPTLDLEEGLPRTIAWQISRRNALAQQVA